MFSFLEKALKETKRLAQGSDNQQQTISRRCLNYDGPGLIEALSDPKLPELMTDPFPHVIIDNFFIPEVYERLVAEFEAILKRGLSEEKQLEKFSRFPNYDAYGFTPDPTESFATNIMNTPAWNRYFADIFNIEINNDQIMAFHHHKPHSSDGGIHADYALCSFVDNPLTNSLNPWFYECVYEDGVEGSQKGTRKSVRAITVIYYLYNEYHEGFGGETAFANRERQIVKKVGAKNNRLMAFEVSPHSWHTFLHNKDKPRNSITQWFHQDKELAKARFPDHELTKWQ